MSKMKVSLTVTEKNTTRKALNKIIREVGSAYKLAIMLGIADSNIYAWKIGKVNVPYRWLDILVELSNGKVKKKELRPR